LALELFQGTITLILPQIPKYWPGLANTVFALLAEYYPLRLLANELEGLGLYEGRLKSNGIFLRLLGANAWLPPQVEMWSSGLPSQWNIFAVGGE
jgi:hypothetical protein